jgi:hypothetical protein
MDGDGAARVAELAALREKNAELRSQLQEQSNRAATAWGRMASLEKDKRAADRKAAQLQATNDELMGDIESLQLQLSESGGGSIWSSLTGGAEAAARSSGSGPGEAATAAHQAEIAALEEELEKIPAMHAEFERERIEWAAKDSAAATENASLRDQLAGQAAQLRDQDTVVQAAVKVQRDDSGKILANMERVLLGKVEAAKESQQRAEAAMAIEAKRAAGLEERLKDHEEVAVEKADDVMAWLETPVHASSYNSAGGAAGPLTPERPSHRRRASSGVCSEDGMSAMSAAGDESMEETEMGEMTARLRMIFDYLLNGPGPERPARHVLAEMAEACVEEAEALELCRERIEEKRTQMEAMRVSQLRRAQEHRGKSVEELTAFSNKAYEEIVEFAQSAAGAAGPATAAGAGSGSGWERLQAAVAGAGAGAGSGGGYPVEVTMWSLLADGADQRLAGNQYKQQLQDMMQAKMDQLDSDHKREADAAEAEAEAAAAAAAAALAGRHGSGSADPLRTSGRDSLRGSGTGAGLAGAGAGLLISFRGSLPGSGGGGGGAVAAVAAGGGGGEGGGADAVAAVAAAAGGGGAGGVSELMDAPNAHAGYLWKRGAVNRSWKQRWCELKMPTAAAAAGQAGQAGLLLYYTRPNDATPRGVINLAECSFEIDWVASNRKHTFKLIGNHGDGTKTAYLLAAGSVEEKDEWLELMRQ